MNNNHQCPANTATPNKYGELELGNCTCKPQKRFKTQAAKVADIIKKRLKLAYPNVKFSVTSQTYSGGNSVDVRYTMEDESYPTTKEVEAIAKFYQGGYFDGMNDIYEYDYSKTGPTAKYVFVTADTRKLEDKHKPDFLKHWGLTAFDDNEIMPKLGMWKEQALYRYLNEVVLAGRNN